MSQVDFRYHSLHYLNLWLKQERVYVEELAKSDRTARLQALKAAAASFGVARNLRDEHRIGDGERKYEPVLAAIDSLDRHAFEGNNLVPAVLEIEKRISSSFGNRKVLSLTTKMLWLKFRSPIIIYDGNATRALKPKPKGLKDFYSKWQDEYGRHAAKIDEACSVLPLAKAYCFDQSVTEEQIRDWASQRWFKERVFDVYLWNKNG